MADKTTGERPMILSERIRSDAVFIEASWKRQRMLDMADETEQLEAVKNAALVVIDVVSPMNSDAAGALGNLRCVLKEGADESI